MSAAKTYKLGEAITGLKYDVKNSLAIVGIDLPEPPIKAGDKGDKVKQLQAALVKLHRMTAAQESGTFDAETGKALGAFMHDWGFKATEGYDATVRLAMAHALNGEKPGKNVHEVPPVEPPPAKPPPKNDNTVRGKIVANALWGIANTASIHYAETRPIPALHEVHHLPLTTDCSGFATLCYKWAGAPDPNGNGYNGQGYTGTMLQHMKHIPKSEVQKGDLVVFGRGTGHHVCIVLEPGANPLLASHGGESGPLKITLNDEYAWQSKNGGDGITWLTVLDGSGAQTKPAPSSHPGGSTPKPPKPSTGGHTTVPRPPVGGDGSSAVGAKIIAQAQKYLHPLVKEIPAGSNSGPHITAWLQKAHSSAGQPWCMAFASCIAAEAGHALPFGETASCYAGRTEAMAHKIWVANDGKNKPRPGWISIVAGDKHAMIVEKAEANEQADIAGNAGLPNSTNPYDGEIVREQTHPYSEISGWIRTY